VRVAAEVVAVEATEEDVEVVVMAVAAADMEEDAEVVDMAAADTAVVADMEVGAVVAEDMVETVEVTMVDTAAEDTAVVVEEVAVDMAVAVEVVVVDMVEEDIKLGFGCLFCRDPGGPNEKAFVTAITQNNDETLKTLSMVCGFFFSVGLVCGVNFVPELSLFGTPGQSLDVFVS